MASEQEFYVWFHEGRRCNGLDIEKLYDRFNSEPDKIDVHMKLLGYYLDNPDIRAPANGVNLQEANIAWCINNVPHCTLLTLATADISVNGPSDSYDRLAKCWRDAVANDVDDQQIVLNAAEFFVFRDPRTSVKILLRSLPKKNVSPKYLQLLSEAYKRIHRREGQQAIEGLSEIQRVLDTQSVSGNWVELSVSLVELAIECGDLEGANKFLNYFFDNKDKDQVFDINFLTHKAHILRGQVAFKQGDADMAGKILLEAADVPESPHMKIAGPSMRLARDLLRAGKKDVVLEYIERWKGRWDGPTSFLLTQWEQEVRHGEEPDFDPNVRY
ncbi:MAG: hypothetical protein AMXMBFR82_49170 [Candidatus Hydrogenedentota bacterium]